MNYKIKNMKELCSNIYRLKTSNLSRSSKTSKIKSPIFKTNYRKQIQKYKRIAKEYKEGGKSIFNYYSLKKKHPSSN